MTHDTEPVTLIATFRAMEGHASTVMTLISAYGEVVRREEGNLVFEIYTERDDSHAFVIFERYRDEAAFQAHLAGAEGTEFNARLTPLVAGGGSTLQFLRPGS
jgi:quinol monooxygenase YgiN